MTGKNSKLISWGVLQTDVVSAKGSCKRIGSATLLAKRTAVVLQNGLEWRLKVKLENCNKGAGEEASQTAREEEPAGS